MIDNEIKEISDGMALLSRRFAKAGWITGMNITTLESTHLHVTPVGKQRLVVLQEILEGVMAKAAIREGQLSSDEVVLLDILWFPVLSELTPPPIDPAEYKALAAWMAFRAFNL
jgi:hypothetical protein